MSNIKQSAQSMEFGKGIFLMSVCVLQQNFNMTNHYTDLFLCLGFIFYVNVKQKSTSYRVNEMFLSCTSYVALSVLAFLQNLYADIICIK